MQISLHLKFRGGGGSCQSFDMKEKNAILIFNDCEIEILLANTADL